MENQVTSRYEYYSSSSTKTTTFLSKENKNFVNGMFSTDSVDGCVENGHQRCINFESKSYMTNGTSKALSEISSYKEFSNGLEKKSFIQQRVERLYGPGALAHGFFVSRRQKDRLSVSDHPNITNDIVYDKHSKSMTDNILEFNAEENNLRQNTNSALPVMRHLRPEFRAQLPIISSRKVQVTESGSNNSTLQKEEPVDRNRVLNKCTSGEINGNNIVISNGESINDQHIKDGNYFLKIIEVETQRLLEMASRVEKEELETLELSEEIRGKLRAASGKARLLVSQKIQQFKGLCTRNITQSDSENYKTTNEDLQGFWDMVLLQVNQVNALFAEIDTLRKNNWIETNPTCLSNKPSSNTNISHKQPRKIKNTLSNGVSANDEMRKMKEAQRKKMLEEKRKAMRANKLNGADSIEIFFAESN